MLLFNLKIACTVLMCSTEYLHVYCTWLWYFTSSRSFACKGPHTAPCVSMSQAVGSSRTAHICTLHHTTSHMKTLRSTLWCGDYYMDVLHTCTVVCIFGGSPRSSFCSVPMLWPWSPVGGGNQWWLYSRGVQCTQHALVPTVCKQQSDWDPTVLSQPLVSLSYNPSSQTVAQCCWPDQTVAQCCWPDQTVAQCCFCQIS